MYKKNKMIQNIIFFIRIQVFIRRVFQEEEIIY